MFTQSSYNRSGLAASALFFLPLLSAQTEEQTIEIDPFLVEGSSLSYLRTNTAFVDSDRIDNFQASDLQDIFDRDPSVTVGGGIPVGQKLYIRGMEDTLLNVSIDGATQAGYLNHHQGRIGIEPELLKQVELEAGTGAATAGPGALAGSLRFTTKDARDLLSDGQSFGGLFKASYFSNADSLKGSLSLYGAPTEALSVLAAYSDFDSGNFQDGNGDEISRTAFHQRRGFLKFSGDLNESNDFAISVESVEDTGNFSRRPHMIETDWNPLVDHTNERETVTLNHNYNSGESHLNLHTTLFKTDAKYYQVASENEPYRGAGMESFGLDIRNHALYGTHRITYGLDYREDKGYLIDEETGGGSENSSILGFYIQDNWDASENFSFSYGARFDQYDYTSVSGQSITSEAFSPNLSATYQLNKEFSLNAGIARAAKGITIREVSAIGRNDYADGADNETAQNQELGFSYRKGIFSASASIYQQNIDDIISSSRGSGLWSNFGKTETKGYELALAADLDATQARLSMSHSKPSLNGIPLDDGNMSIGTAYGRTWNLQLDHALPQYNLKLGWSGKFVEELTEIPEENQTKPSYQNHDIYAVWIPNEEKNLSLTLTISNLFDEHYLDHGSYGYSSRFDTNLGFPEPGRDVRLTTAWKF